MQVRTGKQTLQPPAPRLVEHYHQSELGGPRFDPFQWLRDDTHSDAAVLSYLEAENTYARAMLAAMASPGLLSGLENDMAGRAPEWERSAAWPVGPASSNQSKSASGTGSRSRSGSAVRPAGLGAPPGGQPVSCSGTASAEPTASTELTPWWWCHERRGPGQDYWTLVRQLGPSPGTLLRLGSRPQVSDPAASHCSFCCGGGLMEEAAPLPSPSGGDTSVVLQACGTTGSLGRAVTDASPPEGLLSGLPSSDLQGLQLPASSSRGPPCPPAAEASLEVLFDGNEAARGLSFMDVGTTEISPSGRFVAVTLDTVGGERFSLSVRDVTSGARLDLPKEAELLDGQRGGDTVVLAAAKGTEGTAKANAAAAVPLAAASPDTLAEATAGCGAPPGDVAPAAHSFRQGDGHPPPQQGLPWYRILMPSLAWGCPVPSGDDVAATLFAVSFSSGAGSSSGRRRQQVVCLEILCVAGGPSYSGAMQPLPASPRTDVSLAAHVLHEELDPNAELMLRRTSDGRFILLESKGTGGTRVHLLPSAYQPSSGQRPPWRRVSLGASRGGDEDIDYLRGDSWGEDLFIAVCDSDDFPDGFVVAAPIVPLEQDEGCAPSPSASGGSSGPSESGRDGSKARSSSSHDASDGEAWSSSRPSNDDARFAGSTDCGLEHFEHTGQDTLARLPPDLQALVWPAVAAAECEREAGRGSSCRASPGRRSRPSSSKVEVRDVAVSGDFLAVSYVRGMQAAVAVYRRCQYNRTVPPTDDGVKATSRASGPAGSPGSGPAGAGSGANSAGCGSSTVLSLSFIRVITLGPSVCELHLKPTVPSWAYYCDAGSGAGFSSPGSGTGSACASGIPVPAPAALSGAGSAFGSGARIAAASATPAAPAAAPSALLRVSYSTRTEPQTTVDVCMHCGRRFMVQVEEVGGGFDPSVYASEIIWAGSGGINGRDPARIPVSIAYRKDSMAGDGSNACILHGYGAYGSRTLLPQFNRLDLALLDRGVVLAAAHVRGGGELGSAWHLAGKRMRKLNSPIDFLAAADALCGGGAKAGHSDSGGCGGAKAGHSDSGGCGGAKAGHNDSGGCGGAKAGHNDSGGCGGAKAGHKDSGGCGGAKGGRRDGSGIGDDDKGSRSDGGGGGDRGNSRGDGSSGVRYPSRGVQYTSHDRLAAWGRSAGGITVGAAINLWPGAFRAAVLDVPFLDVLSTMSDPSLPLVHKERLEWGDPLASSTAWYNIRSYSPYDNLDDAWARSNAAAACCPAGETGDVAGREAKAPLGAAAWEMVAGAGDAPPEAAAGSPAAARQIPSCSPLSGRRRFPHLMLTASLHDPRVPYHEPAKYVAKLRALASGWSATGSGGGRELAAAGGPIAAPVVIGLSAIGCTGYGTAVGNVATSAAHESRFHDPPAARPQPDHRRYDAEAPPHHQAAATAAAGVRHGAATLPDHQVAAAAAGSGGGSGAEDGSYSPMALLLTAMSGGHGGASSGRLGERADKYAFLLSCLEPHNVRRSVEQ